jgi:putative salt-induced outer membrane protein YdiY
MRRLWGILLILGLLPVAGGGKVMADEIWLKNGDHLTGKVVRMENKLLVFNTPYAGEISMQWGEIVNLRTDTPVTVVLSDDTSAHGIASSGENGKVRVKSKQIMETLTIDLALVKLINPKPAEPAIRLRGRMNIGASVTKGNTNTKTFYSDAEMIARSAQNRFTIGGLYNRAEDNNEKTVDNATGYMKYDHFLTRKWYLFANLTGTKNEFKDLNLRTLGGLGVGYQVLETPLTNLSLEAGVNYVNEDFILAEDKSYPAGRWAVNFDHYLFQKRLQFFHFHEGLLGLESSDDVFIRSQTGVRFPLHGNFNATAQLNYDWDKSPPPGKEKADKNYIFTLGYLW